MLNAQTSTTTTKQRMIALPVALLVASIGYFVPELRESGVALFLTAFLIGKLAPLVSRFVAYKEMDVLENLTLFLVAVRKDGGKAWRPFVGTILDAGEEGWGEGVASDGGLYDIQTGALVGSIRLKTSTPEQSREKMREFVQGLLEWKQGQEQE